MRRLLFLSKNFASDFDRRVEGIYQRMRVLLEAASRATDALDILFFVDHDIIKRIGPGVVEASLLKAWKIKARVILVPRAVKSIGPVSHLVSSVMDFRDNEDFFRFTGDEQLAAIRAAICVDTDLIFAHRIYTAAAALKAIGTHIPVVMDLDDIEHRTQARIWRSPPFTVGKALRFLEYPELRKGEVTLIERCTDTFVCSSKDQDYLARIGAKGTTVVPNTVRFPSYESIGDTVESDALFFIGSYSYPPNRKAATDLIETIFPLVRARRPQTRLMIVGNGVEAIRSFARHPEHVDFLGHVDDLPAAYRRASVVCCPIRIGGGTRIKIIEAIAHGRPVVSTSAGAEGLQLESGSEIILRDTYDAFADACVDLLEDRARASAIAHAAYLRAVQLYDRNSVVEDVADRLRIAMKGSPMVPAI